MIDLNTLDIRLSDTMKQRIASGAVSCTETQAKENVKELLRQVIEFPMAPPNKAGLLAKLKSLETDAEAVVEHQFTSRAQPQGTTTQAPRYTQGIASMLIREARPYEDNDDLLKELITQLSPGYAGHGRVPLFAYAFWRADHYAEAWRLCLDDCRFDLESNFEVWAEIGHGMTPNPEWVMLHGSLLNQMCQYNNARENLHGHQYFNDAIMYLLYSNAVLDPAYIDRPEVTGFRGGYGHDYKADWETKWETLKQAIANKDQAALDACLRDGAVARSFSLGHGVEMCEPAFWGDFVGDGKVAMIDLPDWAQEQLGHHLMRFIASGTSRPSTIIEQWNHQVGVAPAPASSRQAS